MGSLVFCSLSSVLLPIVIEDVVKKPTKFEKTKRIMLESTHIVPSFRILSTYAASPQSFHVVLTTLSPPDCSPPRRHQAPFSIFISNVENKSLHLKHSKLPANPFSVHFLFALTSRFSESGHQLQTSSFYSLSFRLFAKRMEE